MSAVTCSWILRGQSANFQVLFFSDCGMLIHIVIVIEVVTMIKKAPAMQVRHNLGDLLSEVEYRHNTVLITKAGKPVAALVDIPLFEKIRLLEEEFERLAGELALAYNNVDLPTAEAEVAEAVEASRQP